MNSTFGSNFPVPNKYQQWLNKYKRKYSDTIIKQNFYNNENTIIFIEDDKNNLINTIFNNIIVEESELDLFLNNETDIILFLNNETDLSPFEKLRKLIDIENERNENIELGLFRPSFEMLGTI